MQHRTDSALRRLRQDVDACLDEAAVHDACRQAEHRWRDCLLTPVAVLRWFVVQVLHGNTALTHVSLLAGRSFTDAAFCQARARLPLPVYQAVLRGLTGALIPDTQAQGTWRGHRTFLVDGSSFSMPDTPELRVHFRTSGRATSWWATAGSAPSCIWRCSSPVTPMRCSASTPDSSSTSRRTGRT